MTDAVLVLNAGSSGIKFPVYAHTEVIGPALMNGKIMNISQSPVLSLFAADGIALPKSKLVKFDDMASHEDIILCYLTGFSIKTKDTTSNLLVIVWCMVGAIFQKQR